MHELKKLIQAFQNDKAMTHVEFYDRAVKIASDKENQAVCKCGESDVEYICDGCVDEIRSTGDY